MQEIINLIDKINSTLTKGTLCDGAEEIGIFEGRGKNITLSMEQIEKSEVIVVWGRNIILTNRHILPFIEGKN